MKPGTTRGRWRRTALLPLFGVLFWIASVGASTIPGLLVLGVNVHGLSLASYAGDPEQHLAPVSQQVVQEILISIAHPGAVRVTAAPAISNAVAHSDSHTKPDEGGHQRPGHR